MVNIIIVNFNCWKLTIECIESLRLATYKSFKVFVIDNLSTDNSVNELQKWCSTQDFTYSVINVEEAKSPFNESFINIIKNNKNAGFGSANNVIIKYLLNTKEDEYVWLLNPDTEAEKEVLTDLVEVTQNKKNVIAGNIIHYYNNREEIMYYGGFSVNKWIHGITNIKSHERKDKIDAIAGASLFTRLVTFKNLGLLPEDYFMYWEETDFCTKAKRNGYKFVVNSKSKVFDHVGASSEGNFLREYLYILNGLKFYKKYYPLQLPIIFISSIGKLFKSFIFDNSQKKKALFFGNIDFIKDFFGIRINVLERIKSNL